MKYFSRAANLNWLTVRDHKQDKRTSPLWSLWLVTRGWGHGGYQWYAVTSDGALLCEACCRDNYRQIVASTRDKVPDGWAVAGFTYDGEMDEPDACAHCGKSLGSEVD
jgi:hypothetical protein